MTRSLRRRGIAAGALTLASGTLLASVATAGPAAAATTSTGTVAGFMSAATQSDVAQVLVNLPTQIPGLNTNRLALGLIHASGSALHDAIHGQPDASQALARLASGTLVDGATAPLAALGKTVTASLTGNRSASGNLGALPSNPVATGTVGALSAVVNGVLNNSSTANLSNLSVLTLNDLLPSNVLAPINSAYQQAATQAQGVVSQVLKQLQPVLQPIEQNDPTGTAAQLQAALEQLNGKLSSLVQNISSTPLVSVDLLDSNQNIAQQARGVQSQAHAKLVNLNVLGGLVHVDGFTSDAQAFADGVAGDAAAAGNSDVAHATIGQSILSATLNASGLGLSVAGLPSSVVQQVNSALAQVQSALNSVLANIGLRITPSAGTSSVSPDGTVAKATGAALDISLTPPTAAQPLLEVKLGDAVAQANAAQKPVVAPAAVTKTLAFTGANLPLTAAGGLVMLAGAAVLRRRWRSAQS